MSILHLFPCVNPRPFSTATLALLIALALALGHAALATFAMREKSTTSDELAHVTGGYTFNHWNDYRLHPENGLLPQRWQALPLVFQTVNYPALTREAWHKSDVWATGYDFFYRGGNNHERMLFAARAMNSLFGAATVMLVFCWARRLWGTAGAVVSATLAALCPTMLAHSGLATSDMCMAFFFLAASGAYWRHLHDSGTRWWLLSAATFGLACVAKHTAVLLLPIFGLLLVARVLQPTPLVLAGRTLTTTAGRLGWLLFSLGTHGMAAVLTLWAFSGFRYTAFNPALPPGDFTYPWGLMLSYGGIKAAVIQFCRDWHLLPEGWLYGLAFVLKHAEARGAFLDGSYSIYGWVSFFPKAFLYKTPPSLLVALAATITLIGLRLRTAGTARLGIWVRRTAPLLVLFAVYWAFSLASHLNIGHRHILPTYPVLYIFCGSLGWAAADAWRRSRVAGGTFAVLLVLLLGWHGFTAAKIYPHYLAYFSPIAGGPEKGYQHLVDSSLDWGQDLPGLKKWLADNRRPGEPLYLSYFGTSEPAYYGIESVHMLMLPDFDRPHPWHWFAPGLYAISATMLQHVYMPDRGDWTRENERQYQEMRLNDANFRALKASPNGHPELMQDITPAQWSKAWTLYERLRFARLCHYLRHRQPDGTAGYSILIYRLTKAELDAALEGDPGTLAKAIEQAMAQPPAEARP